MSDPSDPAGPSDSVEEARHRVTRLYHPSHHVPDLDEAEEFFARVFGRPSTRLSTLSTGEPPEGWSNDYATFTPLADLLFDCIDPRRYRVAGQTLYEPVEQPRLKGLGWYVEGIDHLHRGLRREGFTVLDQFGRPAEGDEPPRAAGAPMPLFFTVAAEAGLRHEFLPPIPFPLDHRLDPGWTPGVVDPDDPLGLVRCAHHTIRTDHLDRALRMLVDVLGGTVVRRVSADLSGVDVESEAETEAGVGVEVTDVEVADVESDVEVTDVELADTVLRLTGPRPGEGLVGEADAQTSITFEVVDLARTAAHLAAHGVELTAHTDRALLTDPATTLGIAWGFQPTPAR